MCFAPESVELNLAFFILSGGGGGLNLTIINVTVFFSFVMICYQ